MIVLDQARRARRLAVTRGPRDEPELAPSDEVGKTQRLIAASVAHMAMRVGPAGILVPAHAGAMARRIARYRLPQWITAVSPSEATCQALQFVYGVEALHQPERPASRFAFAREHFRDGSQAGARVLLTENVEAESALVSRLELIEL